MKQREPTPSGRTDRGSPGERRQVPRGPIAGKKPGRRGRLSREAIIEAAAQLLEESPRTPLTLVEVAKAVHASPMSLYRHFANRDDLLLAVAKHAMASRVIGGPADAPWPDELRFWMRSVHEWAVGHPQLTWLIAAGRSPVWLGDAAQLLSILERAGVKGDVALAKAQYWVATTTLGHALVDAVRRDEPPAASFFSALGELPDDDARRLARIFPALFDLYPNTFDIVVENVTASIEQLADAAR